MTTTLGAAEVAQYLQSHPEFFTAHPDVLLALDVPHTPGGRAVSLVERQVDLLRGRTKNLEMRLAEVLRRGQDNETLAASMQSWVCALLRVEAPERLPDAVVEGLMARFSVPQGALRLWRVAPCHRALPCAEPVDHALMSTVAALQKPYCGPKAGSAAAQWLPEGGHQTESMALLPLRDGEGPEPFGVLVLGSPDAERFALGMGTAFLERIAEIAAAALSRLVPPVSADAV
jgi:uncharacterized protein YigA (DUF484 family)